MIKNTSRLMTTAGLSVAAALMMGALMPQAARAQNTPAAAAPASRTGRSLESVLADISRDTQITVVADSSVAQKTVLAPPDPATPDTLETQLTGLTRRLGSGTQWVKIMLPQLPGARTYKGDDVADYALAQAKLFGVIGAKTAPGVVEILGQKVSADQATPVVSTLNLKPVYVLINPAAHAAPATVSPAANWSKMSPAEQKAYTDQQVQALKNMTPAQRTEMMQQQGAVMRSYFQSMSPEERQQMMQGMRGGMGGGGNGQGGGGGRRGGRGGNNGGNGN